MARRKITGAAIETEDFIYVPGRKPTRTFRIDRSLLENPDYKTKIMREVTESRGAIRVEIVPTTPFDLEEFCYRGFSNDPKLDRESRDEAILGRAR